MRLLKIRIIALGIQALALGAALQYSQAVSAQEVIIRLDLKQADIALQQLPGELDIAGVDLEAGTVDIVGSPFYFELLSGAGYPVEVVAEQTMGVDERYLNPAKINHLILTLSEKHPELMEVVQIGKSNQGAPVYAVRISTKENLASKPAILIDGMHHAREVMTTEVTTDMIRYLVENYANEETPWVADWVNHIAIWIIPQLNPDGNAIVWSSNNWWRKNARADDDKIYGVDLNRNYPYRWGQCNGSSGSRGNDTYRGNAEASEPETQAIMALASRENIIMNLSYHSYSELVIAPFGCHNHLSPENIIVKDIGQTLAGLLKKDSGRGTYTYGTGWEILYPVDGDSVSWMHQELNAPSYVIEINGKSQGFQPNYEVWRDKTVQGQRAGWQFLLNRILRGPQVRGRLFDAKTQKLIEGTVSIEGITMKSEKPRRTKNGIFQKLMAKGDVNLVFAAPGYEPQSHSFSFSENSVVIQDVYLEPI